MAMGMPALRVRQREPLHEAGQGFIGPGPENQVKMVGHDRVAAEPELSGRALPCLGQHALESEIIGRIVEDPLPRGGAVEDVVSQSTGAVPRFAGHRRASYRGGNLSQNVFSVPDPFSAPNNYGFASMLEDMATPLRPNAYSVLFEVELSEAQAALRSRPEHFRIGNAALSEAVTQDPALMASFDEMAPGFMSRIRGVQGGATSASPAEYLTWHHEGDTLQLVWRYQHELGNPFAPVESPWRQLFHPNGSGGYAQNGM